MEKTTKKNRPKLKLMISIMIMAALFLAELYVMINQSNNIVLLIGMAACILISLYFVVDAILDVINEKSISECEQYNNIYRSQRASYKLLKKNLEEIEKQMKHLESANRGGNADSEEIIKAQKAAAKIIIAKNKETQDRLFMEMNSIEASLKDRVRELALRLSGFQEEIERLADHIAKINTEAIKEASKNSRAAYIVEEVSENEMSDTDSDLGLELDSLFDDEEIAEPEPIAPAPVLEPDPVVPTPTPAPADNGGKMNQDDIAALIASMSGGETAPEPIPEPEPIVPTPAPADNGGKMNQDDIAALIASMSGGEAAPDPIPEPEPIAPAPADNGGKMNQDDIAALIASMSEPEPTPPAPAPAPADNGGKMNQDDIAALIASMSEPEPTPPAPAPAPADNGGKMNQDDIAALIASMSEPEPTPPTPAPLPVDDNPNRMMTPEEIAALLESL